MNANELMQHSVLTVRPDMSLSLAWRLMEDHRIRHLPVVSDGRLIGLVTDRDIRRASPTIAAPLADAIITVYMGATRVEACMTRDVLTISPEADITLATRKMLEGRFGCLPVLQQDQLVGILTEIDLLQGYLAATASMEGCMAVQDAMQDLLIVAAPEELVSTAYQRMRGGIVRHLPIVDEADKLVGIITDRDIRQAEAASEATVLGEELTERFGMMTVSDLMTTQIVAVRNDTALAEAAELFLIIRADEVRSLSPSVDLLNARKGHPVTSATPEYDAASC